MKTIIAAVALALISTSAYAGGKDPSPERQDPVASKEAILGACLQTAGFTHVKTVEEYETIRYSTPNRFYFGSRIWLSRGTDLAKAKPCLDRVGATK